MFVNIKINKYMETKDKNIYINNDALILNNTEIYHFPNQTKTTSDMILTPLVLHFG